MNLHQEELLTKIYAKLDIGELKRDQVVFRGK